VLSDSGRVKNMQFIEKEICDYTESIWKSILSLDVKSSQNGSADSENSFALVGCVQITGAWNGAVTMHYPMSLAKKVASIMFDLHGEPVENELIQDALGEMTNMTGGNIKSLLPEPCFLSLPAVAVTDSAMRVPGSKLVSKVTFQCNGENFQVSLLKKVDDE
jgi:CheY-specific phosphatase CheX